MVLFNEDLVAEDQFGERPPCDDETPDHIQRFAELKQAAEQLRDGKIDDEIAVNTIKYAVCWHAGGNDNVKSELFDNHADSKAKMDELVDFA